MSTKNARFCFNSWVDSTSVTASSSHTDFPLSNLTGDRRSSVWKPSYIFEITSANNKVYLNGSTYTVTSGTYTVAQLITAFNSATSQTLARNSAGKFTITLGGSGTFNFSTTTSSIWDTLGFLTTTDATGTVATADECRYSTGEWLKIDVGVPQSPTFAAFIGPANTVFSMSTSTIKLQGNNLDVWSSPAVNLTMEVSALGAYLAPNDAEACRYWRVFIDDQANNSMSASVLYVGDSVVTENTNITSGLVRQYNDPSIRMVSEGGQVYTDVRPKFLSIGSLGITFLKEDDLEDIEQLIYDLGSSQRFFLCIDPSSAVSSALDKMTHYVTIDGSAALQHVFGKYYNLSFQLREVL